MSRPPCPACRPLAVVPTLAGLLVLAAALLPAPALAGRAQAGSTIGLYSTWDLVSGATTGQGLRDGLVVQTVDVSGDPSSASVQVYDGAGNAQVRLDSQGALADPGEPDGRSFGGHRAVRSDRDAGRLELAASSSYVAYDVGGYGRRAWVSGYSFAELFETFEILYPADREAPVTVSFRLTVDGAMSGNDGANGLVNGLQAYMILINTDTDPGLPPGLAPAVWRTEGSVVGQDIVVSGTLVGANCPVGRDHCEGFIGLYAALDLRSRVVATGAIVETPSGAPFGADFSARLAVDFSPGLTVFQLNNAGDREPLHAWVHAAPVPEPPAALLLAGGLLGLRGLAVTRRRRACARPAVETDPRPH